MQYWNCRVTKSTVVSSVANLTMTVGRGQVIGFLGTNGAGKTTTIKMLLGFLTPDQGKVTILGGAPEVAATRRRVGYLPEQAYYYPYLNISELLRFYGGLCGLSRREIRQRSEVVIRQVGLEKSGRRLLRHYSKGMLQRTGLAQALLHDPDLLILDEPCTGLDPLARIHFRDLFRELRTQGKTIFFSSHELTEAELICDRAVILKEGRLIWSGTMQEAAGDGSLNLERTFLWLLDHEITVMEAGA